MISTDGLDKTDKHHPDMPELECSEQIYPENAIKSKGDSTHYAIDQACHNWKIVLCDKLITVFDFQMHRVCDQ